MQPETSKENELISDARSLLALFETDCFDLFSFPLNYYHEARFKVPPTMAEMRTMMSKKYENLLIHGFIDVLTYDSEKQQYELLSKVDGLKKICDLQNYDPEIASSVYVVIETSAAGKKFLEQNFYK